MLAKIFYGLIALVVIVVVIGFLLPSEAEVERSIVIDAPVCTVFAQANSFAQFNKWSPWAKIDPDTVYTYEGPPRGVGAKMSWQSDDSNVGSGSQEIVASEPYETVKTKLDFGPQGTADAHFDLEEEGEGTRVSWGFETDFGSNLIGRYMGLMFDKWVGGDYERGLEALKAHVEALPGDDWCDLEIELVDLEPRPIAYVSSSSGTGSDEIGQALGEAYGQLMGFLGGEGLEMAGPPIAINRGYDETTYTFDAGVPISAEPEGEIAEGSAVGIGQTPGGMAVRVVHRGAYTNLATVYGPLDAYIAAHGLEKSGASWEEYVSDPTEVPEEEVITHVYQPVKQAEVAMPSP